MNGTGNGSASRPPAKAWLLIPEGEVPERWRDRAFPLALVALLPEEAEQVLKDGTALPAMTGDEEEVARLAARGMSADEIAARLHMTPRSVYRRLARLRQRVGARTQAELAARLSERGF